MKRMLSWILMLALIVSYVPAGAVQVFAAQQTPAFAVSAETVVVDADLPEGEELLEGYAYQLFYGQPSTYRRLAGDQLSGDEKLIYEALVPIIKQISAGERTSTVIGLGQEVTLEGVVYKADVPVTFTSAEITRDGLGRILGALLTDLPYELYWYDKVTGTQTLALSGNVIYNIQLSLAVADNYQGDSEYTVDCAEARSAVAAAQNSAGIIAQYAGCSDYDKLVGYKTAICNLVEYNRSAAISGNFSLDNDPWQLIHVFDGDTTTNVVCEGYSKAFMYLCEQTSFSEDVSCYTVSGDMGGAHMWNIVTVGEQNYLVDVTNSENGTVGYDGSLFLAGGTGSVTDGYRVGTQFYTYGDSDIALWGAEPDSILYLAATAYVPNAVKIIAIGQCGDNIDWTLDNAGTLTVSGTGAIPNGPTGGPSWNIEHKEHIKKVVVAPGITTIGTYVFAALPNLTEAVIPQSVTVIEIGAFSGCQALKTVVLPQNLTEIHQSAFSGCSSLDSVEIPQKVTIIGDVAFSDTSITSVFIPASVETLGINAFSNCFDLTGIWVDEANEHYSSDENGVLYNKDQTILYQAPCNLSGDYAIAEGVTTVASAAFANSLNLNSVTIPASVTLMQDDAFWGLTNLTGIWVDDENANYSNDENGVLFNKDKTELVRAPGGISGTYTVPAGVSIIHCHAFLRCLDLTSVILSEGVTTLRQNAFIECRNLLTITLPASLEYVDSLVFTDSRNLTDVYYAGTLEQWEQITILNGNDPLLEAELHYYGKHEHSYVYVDAKEPTCDQVGWHAYRYCQTCDDTTYEEIPELGHAGSGYLTPSTCLAQGYYTYICDRCGYSYIDDYLPLEDHRWGEGVVTVQPTEENPGERTYTCIWCPTTRTEIIPVLDHVHVYQSVVTKPTCTEQGYTTHTCACGDSYVDTYQNARGHNLGKPVVQTPAGCNTEGVQRKDCSRCDYYETEIIKPTGRHNYVPTVTLPTCTEQGYTTYFCTCGDNYTENYVEPQGHVMGQWTVEQEANCEQPRIMRLDCLNCDYFETAKDGEPVHDFGPWELIQEADCLKPSISRRDCKKCSHYEQMQGPVLGHEHKPTIVKPTYTKPGYTLYICHCGDFYEDDYTEALGLPSPEVSLSADKTALIWNHDGEASGYEIYRATSKTGKYTKVATAEAAAWLDTSASVGKTYYYKVKAVYAEDTSLNSAFSNVVSMAAVCDAPELEVAAGSTGKPVLTWNKITGAKKYEIWRSVDGADFKKLTTSTKTTYTDTKATEGAECIYKVKALGSSSTYNGAFSNEDGCYVTCAAPSLSAKIDTASGKPSLSWGKITGATGYTIYRSVNGGEFAYLTTITATTYLDQATAADNQYGYYVIAVGKAEVFNSVASATKTVTVTVGQPKLSGTVNENGKPVITWEAVEDAVEYKIYRSTSATKSYKLVTTQESLSYTDESVAAGKTYYYKVVAVGKNSESAQSAYVKLTGKCDIPVLEVEAGNTGKPVLTWNKIAGAKKYEIWRSVDGAAFKKLTTSTKTTYTDTKATEGAECVYKVKALGSKSAYNGAFSNEDGCYVTCAAPSLSAKIDTASGKPSLSWGKITGATGYAIYRSVNGGEFAYLTTITATTYLDQATAADNQYGYYVIAVGKAEVFNSVASATKTVTVTVGQPKVSGTVNENGKPVITWEAVEDAVEYKIYRSTSATKSYKLVTTQEGLSYTDESVAAGKTYYYKVVAVGKNSESAQSSYVKLSGKCAQPVATVGFNQDSGKPTITWEKVSGAKKYEIWRSTSRDSGFKKLTTVTKTTYTDTKASVGTFYYYQVRAVGSSSSTAGLFSQARGCLTVCAKPAVTVKADSKTAMPSLSWKKVDGAVKYEIYRALRAGEFECIATVTTTSYLDKTAHFGDTYRYQVKAVAKNTLCDNLSEQDVFSVACKKVSVTIVKSETGKPAMTWKAVEGATIYAVYRSTKKTSGFKLRMQTGDTSYIDNGAEKGKTYYYYVTAMAQDTESPKSNVVKIKSTK